jgi:hypothetical protein
MGVVKWEVAAAGGWKTTHVFYIIETDSIIIVYKVIAFSTSTTVRQQHSHLQPPSPSQMLGI